MILSKVLYFLRSRLAGLAPASRGARADATRVQFISPCPLRLCENIFSFSFLGSITF